MAQASSRSACGARPRSIAVCRIKYRRFSGASSRTVISRGPLVYPCRLGNGYLPQESVYWHRVVVCGDFGLEVSAATGVASRLTGRSPVRALPIHRWTHKSGHAPPCFFAAHSLAFPSLLRNVFGKVPRNSRELRETFAGCFTVYQRQTVWLPSSPANLRQPARLLF